MSVKKSLMIALVLALLATPVLWSAGSSRAEAAPPRQDAGQRTITVTGNGTAYGKPDVVMVSLGVQASNADILAAMNETNGKMQAVIQALKDNGVSTDDIRTDNYSIYQDYSGPTMMDASGSSGQQATIYRVSIGVMVTVRTPDKVGELLAAAVSAGANMVNYIQFDIADHAALQSQARELAVADAKTRAEQLAGLLGLKVGEALTVVENGESYGVPMGLGGGGGGAMVSAPPISQGTLSVSMSVTITYALVAG